MPLPTGVGASRLTDTMRLIRHSLRPQDFWMLVWFFAYVVILIVLLARR